MATIEKRISKSGAVSYRVLVRLKGCPTQSATFERLTDARKWEQDQESAIRNGRHFKTSAAKTHTVEALIERYTHALSKSNPKRYKDVKPMLDWWKSELGCYLLADLNKGLITEKIEKLAAGTRTLKGGKIKNISPGRVNRYIAALSHVCSVGVNQWEWMEQHPMQKITRMKEPRGRVRYLSDVERERLLDACKQSKNPFLYTVVVLALSTGARYSEIMGLKWDNICLIRNVITLHETKNKDRRLLPLSSHALELVRALKDDFDKRAIRSLAGDDLVFPSPYDIKRPYDIHSAWDTARKVAGIVDFRFHDLRHSAASYLAMNGASLMEIGEVLGHRTPAMTKRYAHLSDAHTHSVVASMNEKIFGK